jgi:DNA polymerase (family 10)
MLTKTDLVEQGRKYYSAPFLFRIMKSFPTNTALVNIFNDMADCYRFMGKSERFRALAYEKAAKEINNMQQPIDLYKNDRQGLIDLKNIGESIADKILEYLQTGTIQIWEILIAENPKDLFSLMHSTGIGPATIRLIHEHWDVKTKKELLLKLNQAETKSIPGIGLKKWQLIKNALNIATTDIQRFPIDQIIPIAQKCCREIAQIKGITQCVIAGSLRRRKPTIGDIDLIAVLDVSSNSNVYTEITALKTLGKAIQIGTRKMQFHLTNPDIQLDIRFIDKSEFGSALVYFTGPVEHNLALRKRAASKGWKLNEYGLFDRKTQKKLAGETEDSVYHKLGLPYLEPALRVGVLPEQSISSNVPMQIMEHV